MSMIKYSIVFSYGQCKVKCKMGMEWMELFMAVHLICQYDLRLWRYFMILSVQRDYSQ